MDGAGAHGAPASSWGINDRSRPESAGDGSHVSFLFTRLDGAGTCRIFIPSAQEPEIKIQSLRSVEVYCGYGLDLFGPGKQSN